MKTIQTLLLGAAFTLTAVATPITFYDPYNVGAPDVIGHVSQFDIESLTFQNVSAGGVTISTKLNYDNGDTTLATFGTDDVFTTLNIGDILFRVGGVSKYAIVLRNHDGLNAGSLYQLNNGALTAFQLIGFVDPLDLYYRADAEVWANNAGPGTPTTLLNTGSVSTTLIGSGPEIQVTVNIGPTVNSQFLTDFNASSFSFASATCGNDIISGTMTPEPASMAMMGSALAALVYLRRRRTSPV
jgi:hypothetical protein